MCDKLERIRVIKKQNESDWLRIEEVISVGIGMTSTRDTGIIISVKNNLSKIRKKIPLKIDDVQIEIQKSEQFEAL